MSIESPEHKPLSFEDFDELSPICDKLSQMGASPDYNATKKNAGSIDLKACITPEKNLKLDLNSLSNSLTPPKQAYSAKTPMTETHKPITANSLSRFHPDSPKNDALTPKSVGFQAFGYDNDSRLHDSMHAKSFTKTNITMRRNDSALNHTRTGRNISIKEIRKPTLRINIISAKGKLKPNEPLILSQLLNKARIVDQSMHRLSTISQEQVSRELSTSKIDLDRSVIENYNQSEQRTKADAQSSLAHMLYKPKYSDINRQTEGKLKTTPMLKSMSMNYQYSIEEEKRYLQREIQEFQEQASDYLEKAVDRLRQLENSGRVQEILFEEENEESPTPKKPTHQIIKPSETKLLVNDQSAKKGQQKLQNKGYNASRNNVRQSLYTKLLHGAQ